MTTLTKPVRRITNTSLDGSYGADRSKRIVVTLIPGDGKDIPDLLELRPERTRRAERVAVKDVYRYAMRCRVNTEVLAKARARKEKKAERLARRRLESAERRFKEKLRKENAQ